MTPLPAISLHEPWATLLFIPLPPTCERCDVVTVPMDGRLPGLYVCPECDAGHEPVAMVKEWETRSRPPARTIVGKRVLIYAARVRPKPGMIGDWRIPPTTGPSAWMASGSVGIELPLGAIIGSAIIGEGVPICDYGSNRAYDNRHRDRVLRFGTDRLLFTHGPIYVDRPRGFYITDQLPFGDWSPGRWAWPITDPRPITEWCPWCEGGAASPPQGCRACATPVVRVGRGWLPAPIPFKGRQGVFYVSAEGMRT